MNLNTKALCLVAISALSIRPALASQNVAELLPGDMNAAGFINVRAIMDDFGMLFDGGPIAEQIEQLVAMGMPDPRTDIDQVALGGSVEAMDDDEFVAVATGAIRVGPIAQFAAMQAGGSIVEEAHRGVTLMGIQEPESETIQVKLADLGESAAMGTFDRSGAHPFAVQTIATFAGENQSFAAKYGTVLEANDYASISVELPKELRKDLEESGQFAFLSLIVHARAELTKVDGMVKLTIDGVTIDMFDGETVKRALVKAKEMLKEQISDPEFQELLEGVEITREDATARISIELPEDMIRDLIEGIAGDYVE